MIETPLLKQIQVSLSRNGARLFRNNTGKLKDLTGRWVSFGLCEGSSDLIGWHPVIVTQEMVGKTVALFTAVEVKAPGATTNKKRLELQTNFINTVKSFGGVAGFARSEDDALRILEAPFGK